MVIEPLNIVLGSMPIILFAVGSAYGIHIEPVQRPHGWCQGRRPFDARSRVQDRWSSLQG